MTVLGHQPSLMFLCRFFLAACFALAGRFLEQGLLWPPWASKSSSYPSKSSKSPSSSSSSFPAPKGAWSSSASLSSSSSSLRFFVFLPFFFSFFLDFFWSFLSFLGLLGPAVSRWGFLWRLEALRHDQAAGPSSGRGRGCGGCRSSAEGDLYS